MQSATNGTWHLIINGGDPSQHTYTFTVSSTLSTDPYVNAVVDYPPDGANNACSPLPTFAWHGPAQCEASLAVYVWRRPPKCFPIAPNPACPRPAPPCPRR